ncbi:hypothetical protein CPB86DRAFT_39819 [Serendipita vermifera]|nr:hypothetical protein CPB86DRAFT_39819 [Serendipita vermifera]
MKAPVSSQQNDQNRIRTFTRYAARGLLAAVVIAVLFRGEDGFGSPLTGVSGRGTSNTNSASPVSGKDSSYNFAKPAATYWSTAAAQATTTTADHVKAANTPVPVPEEVVSDAQDAVVDAPETAAAHGDESVLEKVAHKVTEFAGETADEIDDFLQKLFEEDGIEDKKAQEQAAPPPPKALTEEEKEEQKRLKEQETREKRADITGRHTKWEEKLEKAGQAEVDDMLEKIKNLRTEVVDSMRTKPEMFDLLKKMQQDGFKQVENTDKYLAKLQDNTANGPEAQKMWDKVLERVQKKLNDRTIEVSTFLQNWFRDVMQKEKALFEASAKSLDQLADEAQADIGMDYAWLDDVTTHDWTRYHGLKDSAKKWSEQLETIFNSTHPDMSENTVQTEVIQVETAMMRVAADLNQALDQIKVKGEQFFQGEAQPKAADTGAAKVESEEPAPSPPADTTTEDTISVKETATGSAQKHEEL